MAAHRSNTTKVVAAFVFLAAIGTGGVAWYVATHPRLSDTSLVRWRKQLASLPEQKAVDYLLDIGADFVGSARLVEALGSRRPGVVHTARDLLLELLDRWQLEPVRNASPEVARLANELAKRSYHWEPDAQEAAAQLAVKILLWPVDDSTIDQGTMISDCEIVLLAHAESQRGETIVSPRDSDGHNPTMAAQATDRLSPHAMPHPADEPLAPSEQHFLLPGGDLPVPVGRFPAEEPSVPTPVNPLENQLESTANAYESRPLDQPQSIRVPSHSSPVRGVASVLEPDRLRPIAARPIDPSRRVTAGNENSGLLAARPISDDPGASIQTSEDLAVMRQLHSTGHYIVIEAINELRRRGYQRHHIELARRLTDPSPEVRKSLAESLPSIPGLDALPWLRALARDEDQEVRVLALTILATATNPSVKVWLNEAIQRETDARIRQRLQRMATRR